MAMESVSLAKSLEEKDKTRSSSPSSSLTAGETEEEEEEGEEEDQEYPENKQNLTQGVRKKEIRKLTRKTIFFFGFPLFSLLEPVFPHF